MTVLTKALGDKKIGDKMEQPLVVVDIPTTNAEADPEGQRPQGGYVGMTIKDQVFILRRPNLRRNSLTLYCLLFTAILGMGIGVIGGLYIYSHYARDQMHRFRTGWYSIPYESSNRSPIDRDGLITGPQADHFETLGFAADQNMEEVTSYARVKKFFKERIEIDLENENYEEIDVPDFRGGRQGRFIHDFNNNLTGIIDFDGHACFVMPLNRSTVLPPRNMSDLLTKMYTEYYKVNTEVVRQTMRAIFPAIRDRSKAGTYIARECTNMPIYWLEPVSYTGTVKRSASDVIFGQFAGKNIAEVHIDNFADVLNDK